MTRRPHRGSSPTHHDFSVLPARFTLPEAERLLRWQGTTKGLSRLLMDNGYVPRQGAGKRHWSQPQTQAKWMTEPADDFRLEIHPPQSCACQCHENTCGAADMDMAERTLRLVTSLRPIGADMVDLLNELVTRAGPAHARAFLKNFSPDDGVPF